MRLAGRLRVSPGRACAQGGRRAGGARARVAILVLAVLPMASQAWILNIGNNNPRRLFLTVGNGSTLADNATVNLVSLTVPASSVGQGPLQMTTNSTQANSTYDGFAMCTPPAQVYVGALYQRQLASQPASARLQVTSPPNLTSAGRRHDPLHGDQLDGLGPRRRRQSDFDTGGHVQRRNPDAGHGHAGNAPRQLPHVPLCEQRAEAGGHVRREGDLYPRLAVNVADARDANGRRATCRRTLGILGLLVLALSARAETVRLDDSLSQVTPPVAEWAWEPGSIRSGNTRLVMRAKVDVRLDTRKWLGQPARIYMVMPVEGAGLVTAEWETQGRLLGGRLNPGERALVFSGNIPGPWLEDTMRVQLTADSRKMTQTPARLSFHFEMDSP